VPLICVPDSGIGVFAVFDAIDVNPFRIVVDAIEDSIIPDPDAKSFFARQLETAGRARISGKATSLPNNAQESRCLQAVEILLGRGKDKEVIHDAF
jgi:hypothetical protein